MTGSDLNLKGTRQDIGTQGTENGQPIVLMDFTNGGAKKFQAVTRTLAERGRTKWQTAGSPSGQRGQLRTAVRDRPRPRDQVRADGQLPRQPERHPRHERRRDHRHRLHRGGEGPRARAPDRRPPVQLPSAREDRDLGDARQGLTPAGEEGRDRRPHRRRALPADLLSLPRPRRGDRPRHLRRAPVRGAPASST